MSDQYISLIARAKLPNGHVANLVIHDGRLVEIKPPSENPLDEDGVIDARGRLVLPGLCEPHAHLDKALTASSVVNATGDLRGAMDAYFLAGQSGAFSHDECVERVGRALDIYIRNGVTSLRSHIDVGVGTSFDHLAAVQEAISKYINLIDVQLVALMYAPLTGPAGAENRRRLADAIDRGVHVLGAAPQLEPDGPAAIDLILDKAEKFALPVDLHLDETLDPKMLQLKYLARAVIERKSGLAVTASHCVSLSVQTPMVQGEVAEMVAQAGINIVSLPQTNLYLQAREILKSTPRGITPVKLLRSSGVTVAVGGDNFQDPFNPLGSGDPLEMAALEVTACQDDPRDALELVSNNARRVLGQQPILFQPGDPADFLVIDASTIQEVVALRSASRTVIKKGRLTSISTTTVNLFR